VNLDTNPPRLTALLRLHRRLMLFQQAAPDLY